ncbi:hypothetical protein [Hymenobacter chitinivorans]|uniref:Uncharacterized protein n=1 Tax=Hymenobacter chitinivorans DSM 11115 TaxID=1121954 RepID=A0A2M9BPL7_9BACT|nr:hypothetical protein [Hymenobacter chitinivorans]PJJ59858.1 hypothetical protein CLV45_1280 [Hymenobacter chitinivorans DSM 11115]
MPFVALLLLLLLSACAAPEREPAVPAGFVARTVAFAPEPKFVSPPGAISLHVPARYDTLLTWVDQADTPGGDQCKYRFVAARGCLLQESGFYRRGTVCQGPLDRLTIITQATSSAEESLATVARRRRHADETNQAIGVAPIVWKSQKLVVVDGRTFSVVESFGGNSLVAAPYSQVRAVTVLPGAGHNWEVTLLFECKQPRCQHLGREAAQVLQSVRVATPAGAGSAPGR